MKFQLLPRWLAVAAACLAVSVAGAHASEAPVGVAVNIKALNLNWGATGSGYVDLSIDGLNGSEMASASAGLSETTQLTARLEPGKVYFLGVSSDDLGDLTIQAVPPPGYVMEIERIARERMVLPYDTFTSVRLRVRAPHQEYWGRAGTATALASGRIFWQAALGSLANGASAGALAIIDTGTGATPMADLFSPAGIVYEHTSSDVQVIYRSASDPYYPGAIHQILAPEACVDVFVDPATPGKAQFKFYHRAQLLPGTGVRSFTGDPFAWYQINQDGAEPNKFIIQCDLRDVHAQADLTTTGLPVVATKRTVLVRAGSAPNFTWTADDWHDGAGASLSRDTRVRSGGNETITVAEPGGATALQGARTYNAMPWGEEIATETRGTAQPVVSTREYYTAAEQAGSYSRPRSRTATGGGWEAYEYYDYAGGTADAAGALQRRHRPFQNSSLTAPADLAAHTAGEVTTYTYALDAFGRRSRPASAETKIGGIVTARMQTTYSEAAAGFTGHTLLRLVTATREESSADGATLATVVRYFREDAGFDLNPFDAVPAVASDDFFRMQTHSITHPDGSREAFVYQRGTWEGGSNFTLSAGAGIEAGPSSRISVIRGRAAAVPDGGSTPYPLHGSYDIDDVHLVARRSTIEVVIRDEYARIRRTETQVWTGTEWVLLDAVDYGYNYANQPVARTAVPGGTASAAWSGERKLWEQDESGVRTAFTARDAAGRVSVATREAGGSVTALATRYTYDAADRITETRTGWGQSEQIVATRSFDAAGRLSSATPPGLGTISFAYDPAARSRTALLPDGGSRTETHYADGQLASVTGTATVPEHYTYAIQTGGERYARVNVGVAASPRLRESWSDWLGRPKKSSRPGWTGQPAFVTEQFYVPGSGRLEKTTATGYAPTVYGYDSFGALVRTGLDLDGNGLAENSIDRISDALQQFEPLEGAWWLREETRAYAVESNAAATTTSVSRRRLTGHSAGRVEETRETDAEGNTVVRTVDLNPTAKTVTVTTVRPGHSTPAVETIVNGLPATATGHDGLTATFGYDSLGRRRTVTDARNLATTTFYLAGTTLVHRVTDGTGTTVATYDYDTSGRVRTVTDAGNRVTRTSYTPLGQLWRRWGGGTVPVAYGYNAYGEQTTQQTFRGGSNWNATEWSGVTPGTGDTTTWAYHEPTGLLETKRDAADQAVTYAYNERGQVRTRTSARSIVTTYAYHAGTGELTGETYPVGASTPAVGYTYTRLGQLRSVTDATGERTFHYDPAKPWRLRNENLPEDFYGIRHRTAVYAADGWIGRSQGFQLGSAAGSAADLEQAWGYEPAGGRYETLASSRSAGAGARTFRYGYKANTPFVETLGIDGGHAFRHRRDYETQRDLLTFTETKWGDADTARRTRFDYTHDALYRRRTARVGGTAFADYTAGQAYADVLHVYGYSTRGELESAALYRGNASATAPAAGDELPGRRFEYGYDTAGNRRRSGATATTSTVPGEGADDYYANGLNQYDARENNRVTFAGTAGANAAVALAAPAGSGAVAMEKRDRAWSAAFTPDNAAGFVRAEATAYAVAVGGGSGGADLLRSEARAFVAPLRVQVFGHDADGNLTHDSLWDYIWDAENRLVAIQHRPSAIGAGWVAPADARRLEFAYDYLGRRVRKTVFGWNGTAYAVTAPLADTKFVYDGWNLVLELNGLASNAAVRSYTWGLDLAGSPTRTGGVGALLQWHDHALNKTYLPAYDGNGNIVALYDADGTGTAAVVYEYGPFGEPLRAQVDPTLAAAVRTALAVQPFRFSTKYHDAETGLAYYGHRYYAASLGRFINRDPIGEQGGLNLYGFAGNDPVNGIDVLGMWNFFDALARLFGGGGRTESDGGYSDWGDSGWGGWGDPFGPYDDYWDDEGGVPALASRSPGALAPEGALPRMPFEQMAQRGQSPTDARKVVHAPDRGVTISTITGREVRAGGSIADGGFPGNPVFARQVGAGVQAVGSVVEIAAGVLTAKTGVGVAMIVHGADNLQAALRNLGGNDSAQPALVFVVAKATGSEAAGQAANIFVGYGLGAASIAQSLRAAGLKGPVEFRAPPGATPEQIAQARAYAQGVQEALEAGYLSPTGRVSTKGALRTESSVLAAEERARAAAAGTPYGNKHAGHVPDTTWTGRAEPFIWLPLDPKVNSSLGGQAGRYPIGYKPTVIIFVE